MTHRIAGQRCRSARIQFFYKFLQRMMIVEHIRSVFTRNCNLIGNSPGYNTRMIIILNNELSDLKKCIFPAFWHMRGNIRDLRPHDHTVLIAQIIKMLMMLVMRQPDRIRANFTDQFHILLHMAIGYRVSKSLPVLMPGHAAQRIGFAV